MALNAPAFAPLANRLRRFKARSTIPFIAGLFTYPQFQANTARLEVLLHLAVAHCIGNDRASLKDLSNWLNRDFASTHVFNLEDPPEDVFLSNVMTPWGNCRILEGIWERNDFYLQEIVDLIYSAAIGEMLRPLRRPVRALLLLSEELFRRIGMDRWTMEDSSPRENIQIGATLAPRDRARALSFTPDELTKMRITHQDVDQFHLSPTSRPRLLRESIGHTMLERRPLIVFPDAVVLASPTSISVAARRFVLEWCKEQGVLEDFAHALRLLQGHRTFNEGPLDIRRGEDFEPPIPKPSDVMLDDIVVRFDVDKFLHVVLFHDHLADLLSEGFGSVAPLILGPGEALMTYVGDTARHMHKLPGTRGGMTVLVFGGLGRGYALSDVDLPSGWTLARFKLADFMDLGAADTRALMRLFKLKRNLKDVEDTGVHFEHDTDLNFIAFAESQELALVPHEFRYPNSGGQIRIAASFVAQFRAKLRKEVDPHVLPLPTAWAKVGRYRTDALFSTDRQRPLYVDVDALRGTGLLSAAIVGKTVYWIRADPPENSEFRDMVFRIWDAAATWVDRLVPLLEQCFELPLLRAVVVELDFPDLGDHTDLNSAFQAEGDGQPSFRVLADEYRVVVVIPAGFMRLLATPANVGERIMTMAIGAGLSDMLTRLGARQVKQPDLGERVLRIFGGEEARMLHVYETRRPADFFDALDDGKARFVSEEDFRHASLGLAWRALATPPQEQPMHLDSQESHACLQGMVRVLWGDIQRELKVLDRASLILRCLVNKQSLVADRNQWRRTAQAQVGIHRDRIEVLTVSSRRESDRARVSLCSRVLAEMAICDAPSQGGLPASVTAYDALIAKIALMVTMGQDCDAVYAGVVSGNSGLTVYPNGEYSIDRQFAAEVVNPFLNSFFESGFNYAVSSYAELYDGDEIRPTKTVEEKYSAALLVAFKAEYGLDVGKFLDVVAELIDVAHEMNSSVVVAMMETVNQRLRGTRGLSDYEIRSFLQAFALVPRPSWEKVPKGFKDQDIQPWRFRRRLSLVARPIMLLDGLDGERIAYCVSVLTSCAAHILDRLEEAWMPAHFFRSNAMRAFIGATAKQKGHEFAEQVASVFRMRGWQCRTEVNLTELGGTPEQGDIDVLAWKEAGPVYVIECKRLQPVKTIGEIANLFDKFLGDEDQLLDKHLRRIAWLQGNPVNLTSLIGRPVEAAMIRQMLVANARVPMVYAQQLPVPAKTMVAIEDLENVFEAEREIGRGAEQG